MSSLSEINAIHVLCSAEEAAARDRAAGTYDANIASDSRYYMWQGQQQILPLGMDREPELFAAGLRAALPGVNTLRLSFNAFAFDDAGGLHPLYERFLAAAAAEGFKLIFTYTDGGQQTTGADGSLTTDQIGAALDGAVQDRAVDSWTRLMDWMADHPAVESSVWGYELANEAAAYERAVVLAPRGTKGAAEARFVELYARHMAELAEVVQTRQDDARILVGGWAYSARFVDMAENMVGAQTALDYLRDKVGAALVWAAHLYPGWHSGTAQGPEAIIAAFEAVFAPLGEDDILLTETSLSGALINDFSLPDSMTTHLARTQEWFADRGIGVTWFSGAEAGASSLVSVDSDGSLRYLHQHSLAFALNAFSLDDAPAAHAGNQVIHASLRAAKLRNEAYDGGLTMDPVRKIGTGFGHGGNDTLFGGTAANNFLYGGQGHDRVQGAEAEDFLFGQMGDDTLAGLAGNDLLFGGRGNDLLRGQGGNDTLEGGAGADRFDASAGNDLITDAEMAAGDLIFLGRGYTGWAQIAARISHQAINGPTVNDVVIRHADATQTVLLDMRGALGAAAFLFSGAADRVEGTTKADLIAEGYQDMDGNVFSAPIRRIAAGHGNDTINGSLAADWLDGNAGDDLLQGSKGADTLSGAVGRDSLFGGDGRDVVMGGGDADLLHGGAADDVIATGQGNDLAYGGAGADRIRGEAGQDTLYGGTGWDVIHTGAEASTVFGDAGRDTIMADIERAGHRLSGGSGGDSFVFHSADATGRSQSVITDFTAGQDRILWGSRVIDLDHLPKGMALHDSAAGLVLEFSPGNSVLLEGFFL